MDTQAYLKRIGYSGIGQAGERKPSAALLEELCIAHLETVPFENLDIHLGVPLRLDHESLTHKLIARGRGGYCYELNGLFAALLTELGFGVEILSARVRRENKPTGPEFDHAVLRVSVDDRPYLVDVGFGDASPLPLAFHAGATRTDRSKVFRLLESPSGLRFEVEKIDGHLKGYEISLQPRQMSDFSAMNLHHQTSPRSWFTQARIAVLMTKAGPISLIEGVLESPDSGPQRMKTASDYLQTLRGRFGIELGRMPPNKGLSVSLRLRSQALVWEERAHKVIRIGSQLLSPH